MTDASPASKPPEKRRWILPTLLLPINLLCVIPACILWVTDYRWTPNHPLLLLVGVLLLLCGLGGTLWTTRLFHATGHGTAIPWDPPRRLVIAGPYRHVRNPMLSSMFFMQVAEALLLNSWAIGIFVAAFVLANMPYLSLVEEKRLAARFGEAYRRYCRHVPRWIPRLSPWDEAANESSE